LSVVRSAAARRLFLSSVLITAGLACWARFSIPANNAPLSPIFRFLFVDLDGVAAVWSVGVLLLAVFVSGGMPCSRLLKWIGDHMIHVAAATAALLCAGSLLIYRNHPLSMDEYAQYFQSQIFATGRLSGAFPVALLDWLVPRGFQNYFFSVSKSTGAVASAYWPSFALLLTPFTALGIPWACNPAISAVTLLVAYKLAAEIFGDKEAAAWVVLLTAASPEFLVNGISFYSMPAHMLMNALFALLLLDPSRTKAILAGFIGSIALTLHNPFPHLLFALPWMVWMLARPNGRNLALCLAAGYLPLCLLLGFGWYCYSGHLRDGLAPTLSVFSLPDRRVLLARAIGIAKIWIWAVPGLMILAAAGAWKGWANPALRVLAISAVLTLLGYLFVPVDQGHGWGYRYFHTTWIVLPLLAACAVTRSRVGPLATTFEDEGSRAFVMSSALLMLIIGGVLRAVQVRDFLISDLAQTPAYQGTERRVELITTKSSFYAADLVQNDPWLQGSVIRMISHGRESDSRMMAENFPDLHQVYEDTHGTVWSKSGH
jgi:hypothetical protein